MKKIQSLAPVISVLIPWIALAQTSAQCASSGPTPNLCSVIVTVVTYLNYALELFMGLAVVMFVFYVIQYFMRPIAGEKRAEALKYLMWSLIGFFVILSMWGIENILVNTFNLGQNNGQTWANFSNIFPK